MRGGGRVLLLMLVHTAALAILPSDILNLTSFTLQTPYPSGGGVREVKWPALKAYNDSTFYVSQCAGSPSGCVSFWVPETGAHTGGSTFPRSELRQNIDWTTPRAGSPEAHYSVATLKVLDAGAKDSVCIGQIHADGISGHCSIIVELEWTAGSIVAHVRDEACGNKNFVVGAAQLGEVFSYNLSMVGDAVQVVTNSGRMAPYSYSVRGCAAPPSLLPALSPHKSPTPHTHPCADSSQWFAGKSTPPMYIKAGAYLQSSGNDKEVGGLVEFSSLHTFHSTQ